MESPICEQLEERLAALHQASLELVRDISLETLLERIASLACRQSGARYAAVGVMDDQGQLDRFIQVGLTPEEVALMPHPPRGLGIIRLLMRSKETIRIADIGKDPRRVGFPTGHPQMTTFLGVPIRQGERHLGQIYLADKANGLEFSADDQRVMETLASYAAAAISNARLYNELLRRDNELLRRNETLALLNQLASTLATSGDVDDVLNQALFQVMDYLHLEVGEIYLRHEEGKTLRRVLHRGQSLEALWEQDHYPMGTGVIGSTAKNGQPVLIELPGRETYDLHPDVLNGDIHQVACFPLTGRRGPIGVLCVATSAPQPLNDLEMQYMSAISSWVGTAIENMRLNQQGKRLAILEERERIGMDLHDGIIQSIYAVGLTLEHARLLLQEDPNQSRQRIEQAISDLNNSIRDIRAYILDLRPRHMHNENLFQGLQRLVQEFRANTLLEVALQGPQDGLENLPNAQALALFHICQESLANIAKHARARHVEVTLWSSGNRVLLEVHDDGRGFDPELMRLSIGHGLLNMQTRARNIGGEVEISSAPGEGTTVLAWVPFEEY